MFLFGKKANFAAISADLVQRSEDAVIFLDGGYDITFMNYGAEQMFGYTLADKLKDGFETLLPERFQHDHKTLIEETAVALDSIDDGSRPRTRQLFARRANGDEFAAAMTVYRIQKGGTEFAVSIKDISHDKQAEEELIKLVTTDPLTRVSNRREFIAMAEREALRANRYNRPLSLAIFDIDSFKELNDNHGYAVGDKVLQRVATLCHNMLRSVDVFGRLGGEEFAALLPETDSEGAMVISERLRRAIEETSLNIDGRKLTFTMSAGVTTFRSGETQIDIPLQRAESALVQAKGEGRNRTVQYVQS